MAKTKTQAAGTVRVTAKVDGFRRAGRRWSGTTELPADALNKHELAALEAEPMLVVERIEGAGDGPDGNAGKGGEKPKETDPGKGGEKPKETDPGKGAQGKSGQDS